MCQVTTSVSSLRIRRTTRRRRSLRAVAEALAPPARLEVWGSAWDRFAREDEDYAHLVDCCWKGLLPAGAIAELYGKAAVVLGTTETQQRRLGMVNNRVFEALASGARFVAVEASRRSSWSAQRA